MRIEAIGGFNDLEAIVLARYPPVHDAYRALAEGGATLVRLSGSGAAIFAVFGDATAAARAGAQLPEGCRFERVRTLSRPAVRSLLRVV